MGINAAVTSFSASESAQLTAMFSPTASGKMNFCTVQALLLKNLPGGSNLQYGSNDCIKEGCKEIGTHTPGDDATKHVTEEDVGILKASREGDAVKDCSVLAMPPPSPPPIEIGTETVVYKFTATGAVSDFADTTALQEKFADAANVDKTMVSIKVTAASVIIEVTITVPKDKLAATVKARLTSNLTSKTKDEQSKNSWRHCRDGGWYCRQGLRPCRQETRLRLWAFRGRDCWRRHWRGCRWHRPPRDRWSDPSLSDVQGGQARVHLPREGARCEKGCVPRLGSSSSASPLAE